MIPFVKMHGSGNDFVIVHESALTAPALDAATRILDGDPPFAIDPAALTRAVCDRHFGVGADGLLAWGLRPSRAGTARVRMYYWNADGSRAEMCGNGARCVARLAWEDGAVGPAFELETDAGNRPVRVQKSAIGGPTVEIDMGPAGWDPDAVPVRASAPVVLVPMTVNGEELHVCAVSMGNPHAIVFVPDLAALEHVQLATTGTALATHVAFPRGANASFVAVDAGGLHLRTWERGSGSTLACGTATCAAFAAARRTRHLEAQRVRVHQPGGTVEVWEGAGGHLWMAGPAVKIAFGHLSAETF